MAKVRGRFYVTKEGNWCLIDDTNGFLVGFDTKREAEGAATFARAYVKRHGDINLQSFPYSLDQPFKPYCSRCGREVPNDFCAELCERLTEGGNTD